jgi:D-alanyl-D-alanine carboxypeptidase
MMEAIAARSANDAVAVAETGGSSDAFVSDEQRAKESGCTTPFTTARMAFLREGRQADMSSAYDMAVVARER